MRKLTALLLATILWRGLVQTGVYTDMSEIPAKLRKAVEVDRVTIEQEDTKDVKKGEIHVERLDNHVDSTGSSWPVWYEEQNDERKAKILEQAVRDLSGWGKK